MKGDIADGLPEATEQKQKKWPIKTIALTALCTILVLFVAFIIFAIFAPDMGSANDTDVLHTSYSTAEGLYDTLHNDYSAVSHVTYSGSVGPKQKDSNIGRYYEIPTFFVEITFNGLRDEAKAEKNGNTPDSDSGSWDDSVSYADEVQNTASSYLLDKYSIDNYSVCVNMSDSADAANTLYSQTDGVQTCNAVTDEYGLYEFDTDDNSNWYPAGEYEVDGEEIDSGDYYLRADTDTKASFEIKENGKTVDSDAFDTNRYVYLSYGQTVTFDGCEAIVSKNAPEIENGDDESHGPGMYYVGKDIAAWSYKLTNNGDLKNAYYTVRSSIYGSSDEVLVKKIIKTNGYITLSDGQYITTVGLTLTDE